jgi:tetratricopeptide (TPR) repeat protein
MESSNRCFVSMPFGRKTLPTGEEVDFDRLYQEAIGPAVRVAGLVPVRADTLVTTGTIDRAVVEAIARSDVMIVDISAASPNVYYELGLRHALRPRTTIVLAGGGVRVPVDLAGRRVLHYALADRPSEVTFRQLREELAEMLSHRRETDIVDSPFFQLFPVTPIVLPDDPFAARQRRDQVGSIRARLLEARQLLPEEAITRLKDLERDLSDAALDDDSLWTDLMLAYRDCSSWDDVIRVISNFPAPLRESATVVQQNALALNRRGLSGDAERAAAALRGLIDRSGPDSETYGLLGRIYKDLYQRSGDRHHLDEAIDAYRRGWQADPEDIYPGINLATLLTLAGGASAEEEVREVVPRLRSSLDERTRSGPADYWDTATSLELAVLDRDWAGANDLIPLTRARAAAPWMLETTLNNLKILANAMSDSRDQREVYRLIRNIAPEVQVQ